MLGELSNPELREFAQQAHHTWTMMADGINEMQNSILLIESDLGMSNESELSNHSMLWATMEAVSLLTETHKEELAKLSQGMDGVGADYAHAMKTLTNQGAVIGQVVNKINEITAHLTVAIGDASTAKVIAQQASNDLTAFRNTGGHGATSALAADVNNTHSRMTPLSAHVEQLMTAIEHIQASTTMGSGVGSIDTSNLVSRTLMNTEIANLKSALDEIQQANLGGTVTMGGYHFKSYSDARVFWTQHFPPESYHAFVDIMSLLQRIDNPTKYASDIQQAEIHHARRGKLPEMPAVIASFQTTYPAVLAGPKEAHEQAHPFNAMKTSEAWDGGDGQTGTLPCIEQTMPMRVESLRLNIHHILENHPVARNVCLDMLNTTQTFWRELCAEISKFNRFLLVSSFGTQGLYLDQAKAAVWTVVTTTLRVFFQIMRQAGLIAEHAWTNANADALYFWGTLCRHRVMEEFRRAKFREHPKVYPHIVMFLFKTYVSKNDMVRMRDTNVNLLQRCNASDIELANLKRNHDSLVTRVRKLEAAAGISSSSGGGGAGGNGGGTEKAKKKNKLAGITEIE